LALLPLHQRNGDVKMSLWAKSRQSADVTAATLAVEETDTKPEVDRPATNLVVHSVSPPTYWPIGYHEWLPPAVRGLQMVYPAEDWGLNESSVEAAQAAPQEFQRRHQRGDPLCPVCGCPLFWSPLGDLAGNICAQCQPPTSPRMVEDLWLADGEGYQACVSRSEKWKNVLFRIIPNYSEQLKRQQERSAARAAIENEGF